VTVSPERRREIIDALRRGTVPQRSLDAFAVGLERFESAVDEELESVASGGGSFKAVRGEYGSEKTFFVTTLDAKEGIHHCTDGAATLRKMSATHVGA